MTNFQFSLFGATTHFRTESPQSAQARQGLCDKCCDPCLAIVIESQEQGV